MGFRDDLDLSGIADQYEVFNPDGFQRAAPGRIAAAEHRRFGHEVPKAPQEPPGPTESLAPQRVSHGPIRCSTSRQIAAQRPSFSWDSNRYYRDLGVPWPYVDATRREMRLAYQALGGPDDQRLTYCLHQLLNPAIRAEYDALPLGRELLDKYVEERLRMEAVERALERTLDGRYTTAEQVLDEMGYVVIPTGDTLDEVLDEDSVDEQDVERFLSVGGDWQYGFYLWRTRTWDLPRLEAWQALLVSELDSRGVSATLAVGLLGKRQPHRYVISDTPDGDVVFLNEGIEVSLALAVSAATALHNHISAREHHAPTPVKAGPHHE